MAITFPLDLNDFAKVIRKMTVKFWLDDSVEYSGQTSGKLIVAETAPRFWRADVGIINMENDDAMDIQAIIESMDAGMNDFYMYDPRRAFPRSDPDGSILGAATITNSDVAGNSKVMDMTGFPVGYVVSRGDMFSFNYGSGNSFRALHRVVTGGVANGANTINNIEFRPYLADPDLATGKTMTFKYPAARMKMLPGQFDPGMARQVMTTGMLFKARSIA